MSYVFPSTKILSLKKILKLLFSLLLLKVKTLISEKDSISFFLFSLSLLIIIEFLSSVKSIYLKKRLLFIIFNSLLTLPLFLKLVLKLIISNEIFSDKSKSIKYLEFFFLNHE